MTACLPCGVHPAEPTQGATLAGANRKMKPGHLKAREGTDAGRRRKCGNNYILIIFDSCRFDSFIRARPKVMGKLGKVQKRWSYATYTSPSHYNLLSGLLPHTNPRRVFASEYYKYDFM